MSLSTSFCNVQSLLPAKKRSSHQCGLSQKHCGKILTARAVAEPISQGLTIEEAEARVVAGNAPPAPAPRAIAAVPSGTPVITPLVDV
jgi:hypothetical protein